MAGEFLRSRGIDIDAEMARIQNQGRDDVGIDHMRSIASPASKSPAAFSNVSLPRTPEQSRWDVITSNGCVSAISPHNPGSDTSTNGARVDGRGALLAPSLCHPHVHIDKAFLLSHPKYAHLQVEKGDFSEAMSMTGSAKKEFEEWDLLERGQRLIDESVTAGVTHMRAFVELDAVVGTKCLEAGIKLKKHAEGEGKCFIQLCAFAQLPLFTPSHGDEDGSVIRRLMHEAAARPEVDVVGSTPYVEADSDKMIHNIEWMVDLSMQHRLHLDFHLDYNLDANTEPMVWHVVKKLRERNFAAAAQRTVVLGHCARLTLFSPQEWQRLRDEIDDLPISFVGLPTSDLFMMRTENKTRGTLDVPALVNEYGMNACVGINNIGNAFTPYGSCDPLMLACMGIGIYQSGTKQDAELLYECVSSRARRAIGLERKRAGRNAGFNVFEGDDASLVLFGNERVDWATRRTIPELVYHYDHCRDRTSCWKGIITNVNI